MAERWTELLRIMGAVRALSARETLVDRMGLELSKTLHKINASIEQCIVATLVTSPSASL